jgi:hypothetical protein
LAVVIAAALLAVAMPAPSRAAGLPGPATFTTGLADDGVFQSPSSAFRSLWFGRAQALGSTTVRVGVAWNVIAPYTLPRGFRASNPGDPHYHWSALDAVIRSATAHGQSVLLLVGHAPSWAEGPNMPSYVLQGAWEPSASDFAAFGHALALRYSGHFPDPMHSGQTLPQVSYFQAWNEANLPRYIMPQWVRSPSGAILPESPVIYRAMLNAFYAAVKAVQPHSFVLAAGTAPFGDPPGVNRMYPISFLSEMLCLTPGLRPKPCADPPHFDALDHHPYGYSPTVHAGQPGEVSTPDMGKIWRVLDAAERYGRALPTGPKQLWVTEIDWPVIPPVTAAVQATFVSRAFYELWSENVARVYWFELRDAVGKQNSFAVSGLYAGDGVARPAVAAFHFPFVALPVSHNKRAVTIWGKAPQAGTVTIQKRVGHAWRFMLSLATTPGGIFYAVPRTGPVGQFRAVIAGQTSPAWVNH